MALGKRKRESQAQLWVATQNLTAPGHPFYKKLNRVLEKHGFDEFVEEQCAKYYADGVGRPGIPPGVYFRQGGPRFGGVRGGGLPFQRVLLADRRPVIATPRISPAGLAGCGAVAP